MLHLVAWSESVNPAGVDTNIAPAVADSSIYVSGDYLRMPKGFNRLMGAEAMLGNTSPAYAYLNSPKMRDKNPYYIQPIHNQVYASIASHKPIVLGEGITLPEEENIECLVNATPGGAAQLSVIALFSDKTLGEVTGNMFTAQFTVTTAVTAGTWVNTTITFSDALQTGTYAIVGGRLNVANGVAFRFVPVGTAYRPGAPCDQNVYDDCSKWYRHGRVGVWAEFNQVTPPSVDILAGASAGSATYTGYIDLIKTS